MTPEIFAPLRPLSYGLIMADPPWYFANRSPKGEVKNPVAHYACMSLDAIKALPVEHLAAPDCILWLWATHPMLPQALDVLAAWGFKFCTSGVWVKRTTTGKLCFGTGYALRSSSEPFLIGTIGEPRFANNVRTVVDGLRREHSRKPEEAYPIAERLAPAAMRRADLFSRQRRPGWDAWGNEANKFNASGPSAGTGRDSAPASSELEGARG